MRLNTCFLVSLDIKIVIPFTNELLFVICISKLFLVSFGFMIVITFTIGLLLVITRVILITFTTQKTVTYATVSVMLQSGKPLVWVVLQSWLCYSLGYS